MRIALTKHEPSSRSQKNTPPCPKQSKTHALDTNPTCIIHWIRAPPKIPTMLNATVVVWVGQYPNIRLMKNSSKVASPSKEDYAM